MPDFSDAVWSTRSLYCHPDTHLPTIDDETSVVGLLHPSCSIRTPVPSSVLKRERSACPQAQHGRLFLLGRKRSSAVMLLRREVGC